MAEERPLCEPWQLTFHKACLHILAVMVAGPLLLERNLMEFGDRSARAIQHANTETHSMRHEADDGAGVARTTKMKGTFHPCRLGQ